MNKVSLYVRYLGLYVRKTHVQIPSALLGDDFCFYFTVFLNPLTYTHSLIRPKERKLGQPVILSDSGRI